MKNVFLATLLLGVIPVFGMDPGEDQARASQNQIVSLRSKRPRDFEFFPPTLSYPPIEELHVNGADLAAIMNAATKFPFLKELHVKCDPLSNFEVPSQRDFAIHFDFGKFSCFEHLVDEMNDENHPLTPGEIERGWSKIVDSIGAPSHKDRMNCDRYVPLGFIMTRPSGIGHPIFQLISLYLFQRLFSDEVFEEGQAIRQMLREFKGYSKIKRILKANTIGLVRNGFEDTPLLYFLKFQIEEQRCVQDNCIGGRLRNIFNNLVNISDVNAQSKNGNTPLHWALLSWLKQGKGAGLTFYQVSRLIKQGAKTDIKNKAGVTPDMLLKSISDSWDLSDFLNDGIISDYLSDSDSDRFYEG